MKLEKLTVRNMIAARHVDIKLNSPITLICGSNETGKSSICEGIKHALTGESTRVSLKKDFKHLVNDGDTVGYTYIEYDGGKQACITLPNGTHELKEQLHSALPYVLDPELFSRVSEDDRRKLILGLSNTKNDIGSVKAKLIERGCNAGKFELILPFLRSGFDNACKEAQSKAKDAKTSWRTITGETYGDKKAAGWKAVAPAADKDAIASSEISLANINAELETENQRLGLIQAEFNNANKNAVEINNLRDMAGKLERIESKLSIDRKELTAWTVKVEDAKRLALGSTPGNIACKCPECDAELTFNGKELVKREGDLHGDEDFAEKFPEYERTLAMLKNAVTNGERDLASAKYAKDRLAELDKEPKEVISEERIIQLKAKIDGLKLGRKQTQETLDKLNTDARQASESETKTKKAAEYHAEVQAWDLIASALAPDGIPGEMLASALKPINDRITESVSRTGWKPVTITEEMTITYDGRPYRLSSESAKWRTNAMIAEAISYVSGLKMIVLDGFDILSIQGRGELIFWLGSLAENSEIDTAIVIGTLKALPSGLPDCIETHWIENGVIGQLEAA